MATMEQSWFAYWKENMEDLGFAIPTSWFATQATVLGLIAAIVASVEKFGTRVTVGELIGAGIVGEQLAFAGAVGASFFVGAAIGSAAVATGRYLSGGTSLADVLEYAASQRFLNRGTRVVLSHNPQIFQPAHPARHAFAANAAVRK